MGGARKVLNYYNFFGFQDVSVLDQDKITCEKFLQLYRCRFSGSSIDNNTRNRDGKPHSTGRYYARCCFDVMITSGQRPVRGSETLTTILGLKELRKDTAITKSIVASTQRLLTLDQESEGQTPCGYYARMLMPALLYTHTYMSLQLCTCDGSVKTWC